jgi:Ca2+-transporting ATPase
MKPTGLTSDEVRKKQAKEGWNELQETDKKNIWKIIIEVIREPMFILLIACGTLYMIIGDYLEGIMMLAMIIIIIGITIFQHRKTEKALEALKMLASPRALVIRNGEEIRISGREVVRDDIIILNEGDRIPADATLLETTHLLVDESILTGESLPVNKNSQGLDVKDDEATHLYSGTLVVQGSGIAKVNTIGAQTRFGKIGLSLSGIVDQQTRLQQEMKIFIRTLSIIGVILCITVFLLYYFTRGHFISSLLYGLAAAMAILPEEFPVVFTVFLALGAWRLSKKNVLTRKSSSIENLGAATVLCSDKTGTITQQKMVLTKLYSENGFIDESAFSSQHELFHRVITASLYASHQHQPDALEQAIIDVYHKIISQSLPEFNVIKEFAFNRESMSMTNIITINSDEKIMAYIKGAPEVIIKRCKLNIEEKKKYIDAFENLALNGYRVLGVAKSKINTQVIPENPNSLEFEMLGLIALHDPIRPEVPAAIQECYDAGIKVMMITGDYPTTALNIAIQAGFKENAQVITGDELKLMNVDSLKNKIKSVDIFARVSPDQKLMIVQALKASGEIVAMTGDGVNDAPALKAADIGIAMGMKGTDVAREASALVLLDDNFASIVKAIRMGRKIFDNLQKAMSYILAIHIPIIGLSLIPAIFTSLPVLMFPLMIIFMELIIDPICSIAFEWEQEEKNIMKRPPRSNQEKFFGFKKIISSISDGMLLLAMIISVYIISINEGHSDKEVRAIVFSALVIGNIFLILTKLSNTRSFISVFKEKNYALFIILSIAIVLFMAIIITPGLNFLFGMQNPGFSHYIYAISGAFLILIILEFIKWLKNKKAKQI